jgi:hypothetical protein
MNSQPLTTYEAEQVTRIAAWKGRKPGLLSKTLDTLKWPIDLLFEKLIPPRRARAMFTRLHRAADWQLGRDAVSKALGIERVAELFPGPLERCDALVRKVKDISGEVISSESLLANVGGELTELLSIPAEIMLALRTVHRVAACYGYVLDCPTDETVVLAIIGMSLLDDPGERVRARRLVRELEDGSCLGQDREQLRNLSEHMLEDQVGDSMVEEIGTTVVGEKIGEGIPLLGAALGLVLDNAFISGVEEAAQRTFQERWLRDHHKVDEIPPAADETRVSLGERLSQAAYSASYAASFGVVFPAVFLARGSTAILPAPASEGLMHGAQSASRDADRFIAGLQERSVPALGNAS